MINKEINKSRILISKEGLKQPTPTHCLFLFLFQKTKAAGLIQLNANRF